MSYDGKALALKLTMCPRCEARPGEFCRTLGGKPAEIHAARTKPIYIAHAEGHKCMTPDTDARP